MVAPPTQKVEQQRRLSLYRSFLMAVKKTHGSALTGEVQVHSAKPPIEGMFLVV